MILSKGVNAYYTILICEPIGLLLSIYVIFTFMKKKRFRKQPGDLFFMLAFYGILSSISNFMAAWYLKHNFYGESDDPP